MNFAYCILCSLFMLVGMIACNPNVRHFPNGIGTVERLELKPVNDSIAMLGKKIVDNKCGSCHKMERIETGPDISNILWSRKPEWVLNFLLNHEKIKLRDSITYYTDKKYKADCTFDLNEEEAMQVLEYLRMYQIWLHEINSMR